MAYKFKWGKLLKKYNKYLLLIFYINFELFIHHHYGIIVKNRNKKYAVLIIFVSVFEHVQRESFRILRFLPRRLDSQNCLYFAIDFGCLATRVKKRRIRKE
jgi:hypothetical protein